MSGGRFVLALMILEASSVGARTVSYVVKAGDTVESIAGALYGSRSQALYILETNGLSRDAALRPGQRLRIPTAYRYQVHRGETLELLAERFLDDRRRAALLAQLNELRPGDPLRDGQALAVPFQHPHRTEMPESLQSLARTYYGDASKARLIADYNFLDGPLLAKGERVLLPIAHVRLRDPARAADAPPGRTKEVAAALEAATRAYKEGSYAEVPPLLDKIAAEEEPSEVQLGELLRLKAYAYVALGRDAQAIDAFRELLTHRPALDLDAATVSPKIRAALERARRPAAP